MDHIPSASHRIQTISKRRFSIQALIVDFVVFSDRVCKFLITTISYHRERECQSFTESVQLALSYFVFRIPFQIAVWEP